MIGLSAGGLLRCIVFRFRQVRLSESVCRP